MSPMGRIDADYEEKLMLKEQAAEAMYEALIALMQSPFGPEVLDQCHAAIAKAEGRLS